MVKRIIKHVKSISGEELKVVAEDQLKKNMSHFAKIETFLYEPPWLKVPVVLILMIIIQLFFLPGSTLGNSLFINSLHALWLLFLTLYFIFLIVHLTKKSFKKLLNAKNFGALFFAYALFILCIILFFASLYDMVEKTEMGYITYGECSDNFNESMIESDAFAAHNYFYFSSITLFTVGYGDICPMGAAKIVSIINSFIGNFVNVVLMVWVISNFMKRQDSNTL